LFLDGCLFFYFIFNLATIVVATEARDDSVLKYMAAFVEAAELITVFILVLLGSTYITSFC
jgi:hypothetical protein